MLVFLSSLEQPGLETLSAKWPAPGLHVPIVGSVGCQQPHRRTAVLVYDRHGRDLSTGQSEVPKLDTREPGQRKLQRPGMEYEEICVT